MIGRILNHRNTWMVLPLLISTLGGLAMVRGKNPLSYAEVDHLAEQLRINASNDPALSWESLTPRNELLMNIRRVIFDKKYEGSFQQFLYAMPNAFNDPELTTLRARDDLKNATAILSAASGAVESYIDNSTGTLLGTSFGQQSYLYVPAVGALLAAKLRDIDTAIDRLNLLTRLHERSWTSIDGTNNIELIRLYKVFDTVGAVTTAPAQLKSLRAALTGTKSLLNPKREALFNPWVNVALPIQEQLDHTDFSRAIAVLAAMQNSRDSAEIDDLSVHQIGWIGGSNDRSLPIPWTNNPFLLQSNLKILSSRQKQWRPLLPDVYLAGLSPREQTMAAALLLKPPSVRKYYYLARRCMATRRCMLEAAILSRIYYAEHGSLPSSLAALVPYGFRLPAETTENKLRQILRESARAVTIPDDNQPLGPLEIKQETMSEKDVTQWLDLPDQGRVVRLTKSDYPTTSATRWRIVLGQPISNIDNPEFVTVDTWLRQLEERQDIRITTSSIGLVGGLAMSSKQRLELRRSSNNISGTYNHHKRHRSETAPLIPPKAWAVVEIDAPTFMTRIQLKMEGLEELFPKTMRWMIPQTQWLETP